jgi:hypothetical protein
VFGAFRASGWVRCWWGGVLGVVWGGADRRWSGVGRGVWLEGVPGAVLSVDVVYLGWVGIDGAGYEHLITRGKVCTIY